MEDYPKGFEEFSEARRNGFIKVKELKDEGKKIVGTFCTFTPVEIIFAAGAIPVSLCGMSDEPISDAEIDLPQNLCPLIKSSYGFAITKTCPYTYFADLIVGETTCDGKKKMYEYLGEIKNVHVMQLPQNLERKDSFNLWKNEILYLKEKLENDFDVIITKEDIKESIKARNKERLLLQEFYDLQKLCPPPISGYEIHKVLEGSSFNLDKHKQNISLKEMIEDIKHSYENGQRKISKNAKRILITGCPIGGVADKIIKSIEENNNAVVVCYENCSGVKEKSRLVDESIDPIDALTEKYINIGCSVMSPNNNRISLLNELIDEYKVEGVIEIVLQACHTYAVETKKIREFVTKDKEIPYMALETSYSSSDIGQVKTRISAFIEML
ncbi:double-cubane-cluster-containing anaerobic reductase [Clostridium algidicarnis]|uniref:2-hydroxyacyl-CoA dehydratase family protein n=1 Tax=Clostridium algidicarnis TaxID=37659 RepID=A0ABS6C1I3_9CLOT|nr:double-cubane-cluster-containing anaerobic reductase [Clostridium algidicarnis]MBB6696775.1 2-hydroxyacyl-CoA dehydratase [Clostridium algidicarnis]MBU3219358.1 2-hydroxyacyl-CoA dehydratase family protein [Clostridium algidicarnis]